MGWFSDIVNTVSDAVQQVVDTAVHVVDVAARNPIETAAVVVAAPYAFEYATAEAGASALAPVSDAVALTPEQILAKSIPETVSTYGAGNAGFEFAAPTELTAAQASQMIAAEQSAAQVTSESFLPNLSAKDVLTATNTGLNLATAGVKLATVANTGKIMNASTATANGLTGALATSPIQTPSGLITTTPQGAVVAGATAPANGMMLDQQSMMVIAGAAIGLYFLSKYAKG